MPTQTRSTGERHWISTPKPSAASTHALKASLGPSRARSLCATVASRGKKTAITAKSRPAQSWGTAVPSA